MSKSEVRGILETYRRVMEASWPHMHPVMAARARMWPAASDAELEKELAGYITECSAPDCKVRVFWKLGADFAFGGCNEQFAADAGIPRAELIGLTDFDRRLPWRMQAANIAPTIKKSLAAAKRTSILWNARVLRVADLRGSAQARRPFGRRMERSSGC